VTGTNTLGDQASENLR